MEYGTLELAELRLSSLTSAAIVTLNEKVLPDVKLMTKVAHLIFIISSKVSEFL